MTSRFSRYKWVLWLVVALGASALVSFLHSRWVLPFVGTLLVVLQIIIMVDQTRIFRRQLEIQTKQDLLLGLRPTLALTYTVGKDSTGTVIAFGIKNEGAGSLREGDGYFHLFFPASTPLAQVCSKPGELLADIRSLDEGVHGPKNWLHYSSQVPGAVFPGRSLNIAQCFLEQGSVIVTLQVMYKFSTAYGYFPASDSKLESVTISL